MYGKDMTYPTIASLIGKDILFRAFIVALTLGSILMLTNQPDAIFGSAPIQIFPLVLVYLTPFVVVAVSQALGVQRAILDTKSGSWRMRQENGFIVTAKSHGIPFKAFLLATTIGITNTFITAITELVSSGTLSDIPIIIIAQAFALPMLFGLISQTISYRRVVIATS